MAIAARLREARLAKNLTFGELARVAGIPSRQTIYNIETDKQQASVQQLEKLAAALGCTPEWLVFGTGEKSK